MEEFCHFYCAAPGLPLLVAPCAIVLLVGADCIAGLGQQVPAGYSFAQIAVHTLRCLRFLDGGALLILHSQSSEDWHAQLDPPLWVVHPLLA